MLDREELIRALSQLEPAALEEVVTTAYRRRYDSMSDDPAEPDPDVTPEQFARWLAQRHLSTDASIERVIYLPTGAPEHEIRMLEVNRFLGQADDQAIEPLDFTPEMDLPYQVFVADITSDQWDRIQREGDAVLPPGWQIRDSRAIVRE